MTPAQFKAGRNALGLSQHEMAQKMLMGVNAWQSILRWEKGTSKVPGPAEYAIRRMMDDAGVDLAQTNGKG